MKDSFIENEWKRYLDLTGLTEKKMHPIQRVETKKAFMAGMSQIIVAVLDESKRLSEREFVEFFSKVEVELDLFWSESVSNYLKNKRREN